MALARFLCCDRTKLAIGDVDRVLDGDIDQLLHAFLVWKKTGKTAGGDTKEDLDV